MCTGFFLLARFSPFLQIPVQRYCNNINIKRLQAFVILYMEMKNIKCKFTFLESYTQEICRRRDRIFVKTEKSLN